MPQNAAPAPCRPPAAAPDLADRLEPYRAYITLLAQLQIGRRLRGKVDADDLVQETFAAAVAKRRSFRGSTEAELTAWLRRILLTRVLKLVERYFGTAARDVRGSWRNGSTRPRAR
jgi:RNA polymerase sigma-70 factor (ECF subfamily)